MPNAGILLIDCLCRLRRHDGKCDESGDGMNRLNYQKELDKILGKIVQKKNENDAAVPTLFLHSCCAPCSSYVLEYLCSFFSITVFYFNPTLSDSEEYKKRVAEQVRLIAAYNTEIEHSMETGTSMKMGYPISIVEGDYVPGRFFEMAKGLETCPEGGERCFRCYALRLEETARYAVRADSDYFATTLTISPLKNAHKLNEIGQAMSQKYGVAWLPSDFKKKDGYKRSIELSAEYNLYRQNYCGCIYSRNQSLQKQL